jgi:hypothetical protein
MNDTPCECWTDDVWKAVHIVALTSSLKENEEKAAFCTFMISLNRIISCPTVEREVCSFMEQPDNDLMKYISSNKLLFSWSHRLREHLSTVCQKKCPSLESLTSYFNPAMLSKDVWGPAIWRLIHTTLLRAKLVDGFCDKPIQTASKAFITCTAILIPCPKCRTHAWEYYTSHDIQPYLTTNLHMFEWSVLFHNAVTKRTNDEHGFRKKQHTPSEALSFYVNMPEGVDFSLKFLNL